VRRRADHEVVCRGRAIGERDVNAAVRLLQRADHRPEPDRDAGRALGEDAVEIPAMQRDRRRDAAPQAGLVEVDEHAPAVVEQPAPFDDRAMGEHGVGEPQPGQRRHAVARM
jgi:hypothetical protein